MANVTISPVVPFKQEEGLNDVEQKQGSITGATGGNSLFDAVQQATFKEVQMSHQGGVSNNKVKVPNQSSLI